ncbi:hypothetical protein J2Z66_005387 [Paenibacillus eucommiae]|uniref:Uncharacterized protein n=1 Tax=Paenibacillus eucommiae TaxID=1355755 RepID=A0ABS4J3T6_9BACL|nr:hypothetical protein [Paenibacillus eucommiae]
MAIQTGREHSYHRAIIICTKNVKSGGDPGGCRIREKKNEFSSKENQTTDRKALAVSKPNMSIHSRRTMRYTYLWALRTWTNNGMLTIVNEKLVFGSPSFFARRKSHRDRNMLFSRTGQVL